MNATISIFILFATATAVWYVRTAYRGPLRERIRRWWMDDEPDGAPPSNLDKWDR